MTSKGRYATFFWQNDTAGPGQDEDDDNYNYHADTLSPDYPSDTDNKYVRVPAFPYHLAGEDKRTIKLFRNQSHTWWYLLLYLPQRRPDMETHRQKHTRDSQRQNTYATCGHFLVKWFTGETYLWRHIHL